MQMMILIITIGLQCLLSCYCGIKCKEIKKATKGMRKDDKLYGHEIGSIIDTYQTLGALTGAYLGCIFWLVGIYTMNDRLNLVGVVWYINMLILAFMWMFPVLIGSFSFYVFSEVKHLSPNDGIYQDAIKGKELYIKSSVVGAVSCICVIAQLSIFPFIVGWIYYILMGIVICLGMADVLQSEDYNNTDKKHKGLSEIKLYIVNPIKYVFNKDYRKGRNTIMGNNFRNIYLGLKNSLILYREKSKEL